MKSFVSFLMTFVMLTTGYGAPAGPSESSPASDARALAQPVYPAFPTYPAEPGENLEAYFADMSRYQEALAAIRGEGLSSEDRAALNAFAAKSVPLALAGHTGENTVYSPLSLWSALAMLAQCADGESRQQVLDAMEAGAMEEVQETVSRVWQALYTENGTSSLILANSIWLNSAVEGTYVPETLDCLAQKHYASAYAVPMGTHEADQAVSDWVKEQSHGLIGGDQPVVQTKLETLALLASSLYYRDAWSDSFSASLTQEDVFTNAAGQESRVAFMHRTEQSSFLRRTGYQAARLTTHNGSITFVLPEEGVSPESLLQNPDFLSSLDFSAPDTIWGEVQWSMPKFDVDSELNLKDTLISLGITDLLSSSTADLSALTSLDAFLSEVKQLARVKVDEEGVEAAAVTILMMDTTSAVLDPNPNVCIMDLDRPFLFVIRSAAPASVPLFVGVVNQA